MQSNAAANEVTLTVLTLSGGTIGSNVILEVPRTALNRAAGTHVPMQVIAVHPGFHLMILGGTENALDDPLIDELDGDPDTLHQWVIIPASVFPTAPTGGDTLDATLYTPAEGPVLVIPLP